MFFTNIYEDWSFSSVFKKTLFRFRGIYEYFCSDNKAETVNKAYISMPGQQVAITCNQSVMSNTTEEHHEHA